MKCSACRAQLDAYRESDVSPKAATAIAAHLAHCAGCQAFLDRLADVERTLSRVPAREPRPDFTQAVMARIATMPAPVAAPAQRLRIWWIGVYEVLAWSILTVLASAGILHWQSVVAEIGVYVGKVGLAAADLYRLAMHFHLLTFAAAGMALELIAIAWLFTAGRRYVDSARRTLLGAQPI